MGLNIQAQTFSMLSGKMYGGMHIYKSSLIVQGTGKFRVGGELGQRVMGHCRPGWGTEKR